MTGYLDFWEKKHEARDHYWVTRSSPEKVLKYHGLKPAPGMRVADIGVGDGSMTRHLQSIGCRVCSVDLSPRALDGLSSSTFLTDRIGEIPEVDVGLAHLVFQHCEDDEVVRILSSLKLKDSGVLSAQFAIEKKGARLAPLKSPGPLFVRTLARCLELVERAGRSVVLKRARQFFPHTGFEWIVVRCR